MSIYFLVNKIDGSNPQTFNLFDDAIQEQEVEQLKIRDTATPERKRAIKLTDVGLYGSQRHHKSQPRNMIYRTKDPSPTRDPNSKGPLFKQPQIEFSKQNSKRQERLSKFSIQNTSMPPLPRQLSKDHRTKLDVKPVAPSQIAERNKQVKRVNKILSNMNPDASLISNKYKATIDDKLNNTRRDKTPNQEMLKPYYSRIVDGNNRSQTAHKNYVDFPTKNDRSKYNDFDLTRNGGIRDRQTDLSAKLKLKINNRLGRALGTKPEFAKVTLEDQKGSPLPISLNTNYQGSISHNELVLNNMFKQRRQEQERLNKKSFMLFA